jgi:ABC-2 type transport system permease protein
MWGSDMISKEERDKTVEFSLVLPVSRSQVVTAKSLAALLNCVAFVLITWGVSLVAVRSYSPDQAFYDLLALEMQAMFMIELIFLAFGLLLGCAMKQYKRSLPTAVGIILATYLVPSSLSCRSWTSSVRHAIPMLRRRRTLPQRQDGRNVCAVGGVVVVCG